MRRITFISIIILIIVMGFFTGMYIYRISNIEEENNQSALIATGIEDECTDEYVQMEEQANANQEKISPNTVLTIKQFYKNCGHILQTSEKVSLESINLSEEEFKQKYPNWEIQKFTNSEIVLYKEVEDFCGEHYIIKDLNGFIAVYELDKNDEESKLLTVTEIPVEYLTGTDIINIENGMKIYTKQELNKMLEDFE